MEENLKVIDPKTENYVNTLENGLRNGHTILL